MKRTEVRSQSKLSPSRGTQRRTRARSAARGKFALAPYFGSADRGQTAPPRISIEPLTAARWKDFEKLFGPRGACAGCWCMNWRVRRSEWVAGQQGGNKRKMKSIVERGAKPGLIAYRGDEPVGWLALAPREDYPVLAHSRILKPVDDERVWSITCFFVAKAARGSGLTVALLEAAVKHAKSRGARLVEGYPVEPKKHPMAPVFAFTGLASAFRRAGFREVARRSDTRPIMRRAT